MRQSAGDENLGKKNPLRERVNLYPEEDIEETAK
jgi:hypothetical protein